MHASLVDQVAALRRLVKSCFEVRVLSYAMKAMEATMKDTKIRKATPLTVVPQLRPYIARDPSINFRTTNVTVLYFEDDGMGSSNAI